MHGPHLPKFSLRNLEPRISMPARRITQIDSYPFAFRSNGRNWSEHPWVELDDDAAIAQSMRELEEKENPGAEAGA